jgi:hypothetical protein
MPKKLNTIAATVNAFDSGFGANKTEHRKERPSQLWLVHGARVEQNGNVVPFGTARRSYYSACKVVTCEYNAYAKQAGNADLISMKEVMQKKGATTPDGWPVKATWVIEKAE